MQCSLIIECVSVSYIIIIINEILKKFVELYVTGGDDDDDDAGGDLLFHVGVRD